MFLLHLAVRGFYYFTVLFCCLIVVDQTSIQNNLSLGICQIPEFQLDLFQFITNNICVDNVFLFLNCFSHIRNENVISVFKRKRLMIRICQKWKHSPVNQVGAITFCRIFYSNVCPSLRELSGRRQPAHEPIHLPVLLRRSYFLHRHFPFSDFRIRCLDLRHNRFQFLQSIKRTCSCLDCFLCFLNFLCSSHICGIFS